MWPPTWTRIAARGRCRSAFASKSSNDMQRSSRRQSTNSTSAPALIAASGVAMKVLDGQSTVSPRTPANSSAARAPPAQLDSPRLGRPFHSAQRRSKASSMRPSDHCSESSTSVHSSNRRPRSRWSKPIANLLASNRVVSAAPTVAPCVWLGLPAQDETPGRLSAARNLPAEPGPDADRLLTPAVAIGSKIRGATPSLARGPGRSREPRRPSGSRPAGSCRRGRAP